MNATVTRKDFERAARFANVAIEKRVTLPALGGMVIAANGCASFTGHNLDMTAVAEVPYEGAGFDPFIATAQRNIVAGVKAAKPDHVRFDVESGKLKVEAGPLEISTGTLPGDDAESLPVSIGDHCFSATLGADFIRAVDRVSGAMSEETTRYYLNGANICKLGDSADGWMYRLAATDGRRLYIHHVPLPDANGDIGNVIIPKQAVKVIVSHFGKADSIALKVGAKRNSNQPNVSLDVAANKQVVEICSGDECFRQRLTVRLIDGTFPDVMRVVPKANDRIAEVDRRAFVHAVKAVAAISTERTRAVKLEWSKGSVRLSVKSPENGETKLDLVAAYSGVPFEIGFNGDYLLDALARFSGDVIQIAMANGSDPALFTDPTDTAFFAVVMPMRV
jgi:DNA polymerase III subunit beta